MRILYAGSIDLDTERGDALHFVQLARALRDRGHQITVVAHGSQAGKEDHQLEPVLVPRVGVRKIGVPLNDRRLLNKATDLLEKSDFDMLYQRGIPYLNRRASRRGVPSIVESNGVLANEILLKKASQLAMSYARHRERNIIDGADRIFTVSHGIKNQLVSLYDIDPIIFVVEPNAADTTLFSPRNYSKCRSQLDLEMKIFTLLFIGTYQSWVDYHSMIHAVKKLRDKGIALNCLFVGDGTRFEEVSQDIGRLGLSKVIIQVGRIPHNQIPTWIGASDVCLVPILPTRGEASAGSPLKLFEYMACQRPVVGTDLPGIREHIVDGSAGLLYPAENATVLAEQLEKLYRDPGLRESFGRNARDYVFKYHSWDSVAQKVEEIATELIDEAAAAG